MKRIFTLLALICLTLSIMAQSPDLMTYQAVIRDAQDHLLANQAVAIQISIIPGAPNNAAVYSEVHSVNTNDNGLVSLEIGDGVTGDDFSTIDWSAGPFYLKTETDPAGGTNYTITSTTQLLSVPYSKYADEAGNVFSGNYADLSGAPTNVSAFTNDEGYLTTVTGSESAFNNWDKDVTDDFSGNYGDLVGAPTNVSAFTNDAGYLTSELWNYNGGHIYYNNGFVGIGITNPNHPLTINSGAIPNYLTLYNDGTGTGGTDGFMVGNQTDLDGFVWNWEAGPIHFGTNNNFRMTISASGNVGIGTTTPDARLDVDGDARFGANGIIFNGIQEITGTTGATGDHTLIYLPDGYTMDNVRVLAAEVNYGGYAWAGVGSHYMTTPATIINVSTFLSGTGVFIYYPDNVQYHSRAFRILLMLVGS